MKSQMSHDEVLALYEALITQLTDTIKTTNTISFIVKYFYTTTFSILFKTEQFILESKVRSKTVPLDQNHPVVKP